MASILLAVTLAAALGGSVGMTGVVVSGSMPGSRR